VRGVRRAAVGVALTALVFTSLTAFVGAGDEPKTYRAEFSRAVQVFPGGKVRVLGVDVGEITDVRVMEGGVEVAFAVDEEDVQLPEEVQAAIVPMSLLGERYVQLFPAYTGGPALEEGATIPMERTAVPSEPDELLRSLQDYLGALDPATVSEFVQNAARILEGNGQQLNSLILHAAGVMETLSAKRDDLAQIVVEFDRLSRALATRKEGLGQLINNYNTVARTLTGNRVALEGTITGLNDAASQLASLLVEHRKPLHRDIRVLTRTGRTIGRNVEALAETGYWAQRLFRAASNAVDFNRDWLRLNNQGQELAGLIVLRLEERLVELCQDLGLPQCSTPRYWAREVPGLFCFAERCPPAPPKPEVTEQQLTEAISQVPTLAQGLIEEARDLTCADAEDRQACLERKEILLECAEADHPRRCLRKKTARLLCEGVGDVEACVEEQTEEEVAEIVDGLLEDTLGDPLGLGGPG
jgi:phospholipid/cholesterol/gamma-HCH transport system substrate-binding protein